MILLFLLLCHTIYVIRQVHTQSLEISIHQTHVVDTNTGYITEVLAEALRCPQTGSYRSFVPVHHHSVPLLVELLEHGCVPGVLPLLQGKHLPVTDQLVGDL